MNKTDKNLKISHVFVIINLFKKICFEKKCVTNMALFTCKSMELKNRMC